MSLGGGKPITLETLQGKSLSKHSDISIVTKDGRKLHYKKYLHNFPNDVSYMSKESVMTLLHMSSLKTKKKPWNKERANAHLGFDGPVAKRCSVSEELWLKYRTCKKSSIEISLEDVKKWAEMEIIKKLLQPQTWDIEKARKLKCDPNEFRKKKLGPELIAQLIARYRALLKDCL